MRKLLIGAAAAVAATPAAAQYPGYDRGYGYENPGYGDAVRRQGRSFDEELGRIAQRIEMLASQRRVPPREADRLLAEVGRLDRLSDRYSRDGVTAWEHRDLQRRLARLRERSGFALAGNGFDERGWDDGRWNGNVDDRFDRGEGEDDRWQQDVEEDDRFDRDDDADFDNEAGDWDDRPDGGRDD